jgi:membrane-associated protein
VHFDLTEIIRSAGQTLGLILITAIVFAESGLFFGFFLPGDSLLFTAGFLASQNILNLPALLVLCIVAAILGDNVGYVFGRKVGSKLFEREDSKFFKKKHLAKAKEFYDKHGGKAIVLARFMPLVRTFAPIVAGAANMNYKKFLSYNVFGGFLWGGGVTILGYYAGKSIPGVEKYLTPVIFIIIALSLLPAFWHVLSEKESRAHLRTSIVNFIYSLPGIHK